MEAPVRPSMTTRWIDLIMLWLTSCHSYDYTKGKLDELVDIIIDSGAKLFVSAVGVPPKHVVDRLHKAGVRESTPVPRGEYS